MGESGSGLALPHLASGEPRRVANTAIAHHGRERPPRRWYRQRLAFSVGLTGRAVGRQQRSDASSVANTSLPKGLRPYTPGLATERASGSAILLVPVPAMGGRGGAPRRRGVGRSLGVGLPRSPIRSDGFGGQERETPSWSVVSRPLAAMPSRNRRHKRCLRTRITNEATCSYALLRRRTGGVVDRPSAALTRADPAPSPPAARPPAACRNR